MILRYLDPEDKPYTFLLLDALVEVVAIGWGLEAVRVADPLPLRRSARRRSCFGLRV